MGLRGVRVNTIAPHLFPSATHGYLQDPELVQLVGGQVVTRPEHCPEIDRPPLILCSDASWYIHRADPGRRRRLNRVLRANPTRARGGIPLQGSHGRSVLSTARRDACACATRGPGRPSSRGCTYCAHTVPTILTVGHRVQSAWIPFSQVGPGLSSTTTDAFPAGALPRPTARAPPPQALNSGENFRSAWDCRWSARRCAVTCRLQSMGHALCGRATTSPRGRRCRLRLTMGIGLVLTLVGLVDGLVMALKRTSVRHSPRVSSLR